ncbi:uncharacterized protein N7496_000966 [Penicillium cataractarum]|uniref:Uncharacterized protein n=1 Tax=Penicillium cataractarum TaxID=2100454 RepID=A0A9X0B6G3_9EURO|nr:uncharacterized protein N7496_000966 [Penicillium cataractarum]KAJ5389898.1 hypothetical protein N7496_000966 [Penicillium cataractarum]
MSADLLAEFGQGSGSAQSSEHPIRTAQPPTNSLIDGFNQSDDIFFGDASKTSQRYQQGPQINSQQSQYAPTAAAPRQPAAYQAFDLPRPHHSDVLFDATEDTPTSEGDDDDWGEFEGPEASQQSQSQQSTAMASYARTSAPAPPAQASRDIGLNQTVDLLGGLSMDENTSVPHQQSQHPTGNPPSQPGWDDDSFGDWGEFTEAQSAKPLPPKPLRQPIQRNTPGNSLLEDDSFGDWGDFTDGPSTNLPPKASSAKKQTSAVPAKASISTKATSTIKPKAPTQTKPLAKSKPQQPTWEDDTFENWGDFDDGPAPSNPQPTLSTRPTPSPSTTKTTPSPQSFTTNTPTTPPTVRPTNIPPPSILLEHLLTQLTTLQKTAQTAQPLPTDQKLPTATKIQNTLHTTARIIAGRTHRWKRDTLLAQSMRIGPARAGKTGGMKLSAVNKHEDVKEAQDAVDVLALWRERASLFNSIVQAVGKKPIPVVAGPAALRVVTVKAEQGGLRLVMLVRFVR